VINDGEALKSTLRQPGRSELVEEPHNGRYGMTAVGAKRTWANLAK